MDDSFSPRSASAEPVTRVASRPSPLGRRPPVAVTLTRGTLSPSRVSASGASDAGWLVPAVTIQETCYLQYSTLIHIYDDVLRGPYYL